MNSTGQISDYIEAYECAQEREGHAELTAFLPPREHLLYDGVLRELVRVDLEYSWQRKAPRSLDDYRGAFPELFSRPEDAEAIAFEEYRLRRQAGETASPDEYARRYGIATASWPTDDAGSPESRLPQALAADASGPAVGETEAYPLSQAARIFHQMRRRATPEIGAALGDGPEAELFRDLLGSNPAAAEDLACSTLAPPQVGTDFLGFRLVALLGSGAFGHVFLARQGDLAQRLVALKVTACLSREPQTLAQLQHTHIVPIYSLHVRPPYQAVCMPYMGSATFADLLRAVRRQKTIPGSADFISRLLAEAPAPGAISAGSEPPVAAAHPAGEREMGGYVERVLWMGECLAQALAHAHAHRIVHRDLKPANILLTDDGQPMLLDFNLAEDRKLRSSLPGAIIGGTLPYMAPECLQALWERREGGDARSDLYSLGVLLFELLTGQHPYALPKSRSREAVKEMIAERRGGMVPTLRSRNSAVTGAAEAIVRTCLAPQPERRYANADDLAEDLRRQREHYPLRFTREPRRERLQKWARRHPRLSSSATAAVAAATIVLALLGAFAARNERLARLEAHNNLEQFRRELAPVFVQLLTEHVPGPEHYVQSSDRCRAVLGRYRVLDDPAWRQSRELGRLEPEERALLDREVATLLLYWAEEAQEHSPDDALHYNALAKASMPGGPTAAALRQRADVCEKLGRTAEAAALREQSMQVPSTASDLSLEATAYCKQGRFADALPLVQRALRAGPRDYRIWCNQGVCQEQLGRPGEAAASLSTAIALEPRVPALHYRRGIVYLGQNRHEDAVADFTEALRRHETTPLPPTLLAEVYLNRALAHLGVKDLEGAEKDLGRAMTLRCPTRVYFIRAIVRTKRGDLAGAKADRQEGLRLTPGDEKSWLTRGSARLHLRDYAGALADFERALVENPRSVTALQNQAHVLAEYLGRTQDAVRALDRQLQLAPDSVPALAGRGVLHARLGNRKEALADAEGALLRDRSPETLYQVAGIYALTSQKDKDDRNKAYQLLAGALREGYGWKHIPGDRDLDPIRQQPEFRRLLESLR